MLGPRQLFGLGAVGPGVRPLLLEVLVLRLVGMGDLGGVVRLGRRLLGLHLGPGPLACLGPLRAGGGLLGRERLQLAVQDLGLAQPLVLVGGPVRLALLGLGPLAGGAVRLLPLSGLGSLCGLAPSASAASAASRASISARSTTGSTSSTPASSTTSS